jgi:hypothetical protein
VVRIIGREILFPFIIASHFHFHSEATLWLILSLVTIDFICCHLLKSRNLVAAIVHKILANTFYFLGAALLFIIGQLMFGDVPRGHKSLQKVYCTISFSYPMTAYDLARSQIFIPSQDLITSTAVDFQPSFFFSLLIHS